MNALLPALKAELLKNRHASIVGATFVAFALAPVMGGVFILILREPEVMAQSSVLRAKAQLMGFSTDWPSYLGLLTQAVGVGGVLVFGFVASWLFGREYSDGTAKDLLALPTSRTAILNAKFIVYGLWCLALALSNLAVGTMLGTLLQLPPPDLPLLCHQLPIYALTTLLTAVLGTPLAFFALWGKGYLVPLGFVALTLVFAQVIAATGFGSYFPWSVPGLFSGLGGGHSLATGSYVLLLLVSLAGYGATLFYWNYADHTK